MKLWTIAAALYVLTFHGLFSWIELQHKAQGRAPVQACDSSLWSHVYNPKRLQVLKDCIAVTGVKQDATKGKEKDGCRREADGDYHCWIKLDAERYINEKNKTEQDGNLVFEPMCQHKVTQADTIASGVCKNWTQKLIDAPVGARLRITGTWVLDTEHGHEEIHPVAAIEIIE